MIILGKNITIPLKYIWFFIASVIILTGLYIYYSYGFIVLNISNVDSAKVTITNSNGNKIIQNYKSGSNVLIKKGSYNIVVNNGDKNSFQPVNSKRFFQKSDINIGSLSYEDSSQVVASNSSSCIYPNNYRYYSYDCDSSVDLTEHIQSTFDTPSYKRDLNKYAPDELLNQITTNKGSVYELINFHSDSVASDKIYQIRTLDSANPELILKSINIDYMSGDIGIVPYQNGIVVYSKNKTEAYYLESIDAKPKKIDFLTIDDIPESSTLALNGSGNYLSYAPQIKPRDGDEEFKSTTIKMSIFNGKNVYEVSISSDFKKPMQCSADKICYIDGNDFVISSYTNNKLNEINRINNVTDYTTGDNEVGLVTKEGLVIYSIEKSSGYVAYSSEVQKNNCGVYYENNHYYLCMNNNDINQNLLIKLSKSQVKTDSILEQISPLTKNSFVENINISGDYIFITTSIISTINQSNGKYNEDKAEKEYAEKSINNSIKEAGIDTSKYKVIIL
jgi:hypothetical protein